MPNKLLAIEHEKSFPNYENATLGIKMTFPADWTMKGEDFGVTFLEPNKSTTDRFRESS